MVRLQLPDLGALTLHPLPDLQRHDMEEMGDTVDMGNMEDMGDIKDGPPGAPGVPVRSLTSFMVTDSLRLLSSSLLTVLDVWL